VDGCDALTEILRGHDAYGDFAERVVHVETLAARPARFAPELAIHPEVRERLQARKIDALYTHQAAAIEHLRAGRNVVVATGTASGKSLCYQVPIVESVLEQQRATALLLFPTKALAHDQLRSLRSWLVPGLKAVPYDGDTSQDDRVWARKNANVVLTNPDMLHIGMLPYHDRWATFLMRLKYVVIDELHTLRGIFGSHVAQLLRRLRRLCARYGSSPAFCFSSATIGNPAELAATLCGMPVESVDDDGSPTAERCFALWQRPLVDEDSGTRASANIEVARLLDRLVVHDQRAIAFTSSRKGAELVAKHTRTMLKNDHPDLVEAVAAYRAGYLPEERRVLEKRLSEGDLRAVAATNALELGIDIGGLDAVVMNGFPGTLASMWQQAGRAGRRGKRAAAVLVAGDDQLDQWWFAHPGELFHRAPEPAVVNPTNPFVLRPHVACAAFEMPLTPGDDQWFGDALDEAVNELVQADELVPRAGKMFWAGRDSPAPRVGLRTGSSVEYQFVDDVSQRLVGTADGARIFHIAHPGAIYLHQGQQYQVRELDTLEYVAHLEPVDVDEYTQPREDTDWRIREEDDIRQVGPSTVHLGAVEVTTTIVAYQRKQLSSGEVIGIVDLELPPRTLLTRGAWYTIPIEVVEAARIEPSRLLGTVHAAEHAMIGMLPLFAICDRWDVGGVSMAIHPQTGEPTIVIYDAYPGGAGVADLAFAAAPRHLHATLELVANCPCEKGCPSCVQSPKCGNWNEYLDKEGAVALLAELKLVAPPAA
jgi:DEAD/DEAH box helicase domain-containing protein